MKLSYKEKDFNKNSIHDVQLWDGVKPDKYEETYLRGLGFMIVYKDRKTATIDYVMHYVDTDVFDGSLRRSTTHRDEGAVKQIDRCVLMYNESLFKKTSSIMGANDINKLRYELLGIS